MKTFEQWWGKPFITNNEGVNIGEQVKDWAEDAWQFQDLQFQKEIHALKNDLTSEQLKRQVAERKQSNAEASRASLEERLKDALVDLENATHKAMFYASTNYFPLMEREMKEIRQRHKLDESSTGSDIGEVKA